MRLTWDSSPERSIEYGIDRAVLYLNDGRAYPWSGLTGLEEDGGEATTPFYLDGMPFLYLPKPKEFTGTITAYTYPDELMSVIGMVETPGGLILDSQLSDSFNLSYRTISGDGYKIHLVYNITIVPPNSSYEVTKNSINPMDFSWGIQAVPVLVKGYRPIAHIVIDSRSVSAKKLALIEDMLYGTEKSYPNISSIQEIMDLITYGDTITVRDNGDGTFTVSGAEKYVSENDGIFQLRDIIGQIYPDGTFRISSTVFPDDFDPYSTAIDPLSPEIEDAYDDYSEINDILDDSF